jgi:glycosyltransferase involved in cell wall biosynthesis
MPDAMLSVVTPTLRRPSHVREMLLNLSAQSLPPAEVVLVDGAPDGENETERVVAEMRPQLPYACIYIRRGGGTAIQRNIGIDAATGDFIAFIDDDIRLEPDFFARMVAAFRADQAKTVGGIAGYITNQHLDPATSARWQWYRRLRLFRTYEPGRYDYQTGYPINRYLQPPHDRLKEIDFMGAGCAVWRRQVFDAGLRFSRFFTDYGILEDAHLALRASRKWKLFELGTAHCIHLRCQISKPNSRKIARKTALNYRYVFVDLVPRRTWGQEFRFWRVQMVDLARILAYAIRRWDRDSVWAAVGKAEGILGAARLRRPEVETTQHATGGLLV